ADRRAGHEGMREIRAGLRLQLQLFRRNPGHLLIFLTVPFFSAIFLAGIQEVGREELVGYAVFGPAMVGLWAVSLGLGGSLIATLAVTAVAMAGTSAAMAAIFVAARAARRFANALGYPFYILGGLLVPITFLPPWLRPLSWLTYLYWSAGLLRDALSAQPVG